MEMRVEIQLGNVAMDSPRHVAEALRGVADRLEDGDVFPSENHPAHIRDENGNTVGEFYAAKQ